MMNLRLIFALLAAACILGACAQSRPPSDGVSSETHFLRSCSSDSCGKGLSCVCGTCTKACDATGACTALAKDAVCAASADDACDEGRTCDVMCSAKADCAALGEAYACNDGRCRAPKVGKPDAGTDAGAMGGSRPGPVDCRLASVADILSSSSATDCGTLPVGATTAARTAALDCVRSALDAKSPFRLIWQVQGIDSMLENGFVGVKDGALVIHSLSYDSLSVDGGQANWSPCATFSLRDGCTGELNTCFQCEPATTELCSCIEHRSTGAGSTIECADNVPDGGTVIQPASSCPADACEFDGVCYPDGTSSEDGCCTCDKAGGGGGCIEPGWCPGWVLIGKRCSEDADCSLQRTSSSGLKCRTDFFGERGVCTRDCNFGCPTGTECVADVPDYNEGTIHNVCMRPCTAPADCDMESHGNALGSECDAPGGLSKSYCF